MFIIRERLYAHPVYLNNVVIIKHVYVLYKKFGIVYKKIGDICLDFGSENLNNPKVFSKINGREK
jgi:hypothetical protein